MIRSLVAAACASTLLSMSLSTAAEAAGVRVRGAIKAISDNSVTVATSAGQDVKVKLANPVVLLYRDIAFSEVPKNAYVAVPSIAAPDGARRALGLIVFPEKMRGLNEGFKAWDLGTESKMTNATLAKVTDKGGERVLTVTYGATSQKVLVPRYVPITTFAPAPDRKLEVGLNVVIFADDKTGALTGKFVGVHENGDLPPI
ncbi:MAG: hypothetical protein AAFQ45_12710 [Pseudomonadota bacterium]